MSSSFGDRLRDEVPSWVDEDIIDREQAQLILERYEGEASARGETVRTFLYASAAVLIGAAALAFVYVGIDPGEPQLALLGFGLALAAAGGGLHLAGSDEPLLVDAALGASLVPLAAATIESDMIVSSIAAIALPLGYLAWRDTRPFVPSMAVIAVTVAAAATAFSEAAWFWQTDEQKVTAWWIGQGLILAGLLAYEHRRELDWTAPTALGVLALAVSTVAYLERMTDLGTIGLELSLGGLLAILLLASVVRRHEGLAIGASIGLGIDAIVFAFDVDELFGVVVLLALGGLAIWQAESIRGWVEGEAF